MLRFSLAIICIAFAIANSRAAGLSNSETRFVYVDANGKVLKKHTAPMTMEVWEQEFVPLLEKAAKP